MSENTSIRILFIINHASGNDSINWRSLIDHFFQDKAPIVEVVELDEACTAAIITKAMADFKPDRVFAVGGDGTVKLVASCLLESDIPLGIIPAGSANGMAKELGIPTDVDDALQLAANGKVKKIHLVKVNEELCIHLADIGFNAFVVKKFETGAGRGMWGYIKAAWKVLWQHDRMLVELEVDGKPVQRSAAMIVIANATRYGSGALINPDGNLEDDLFEVIVVRKISLSELSKMMVTHFSFDPAKTEVHQVRSLDVKSRKKAHFQVDGEYLGKVHHVTARILPQVLKIVVPVS